MMSSFVSVVLNILIQNILGFAGQRASVITTQLCYWSAKIALDNLLMNEGDYNLVKMSVSINK